MSRREWLLGGAALAFAGLSLFLAVRERPAAEPVVFRRAFVITVSVDPGRGPAVDMSDPAEGCPARWAFTFPDEADAQEAGRRAFDAVSAFRESLMAR